MLQDNGWSGRHPARRTVGEMKHVEHRARPEPAVATT
jgi:hypothetical protein